MAHERDVTGGRRQKGEAMGSPGPSGIETSVGSGPARGDLFHLLRARTSQRVAFDPHRPVSEAELAAVLESLRWAPTAHNMQNYEILVLDDPSVLEAIGDLTTRVEPEFLRENYALLSFSEAELAARRVGLLASQFPPEWLEPSRFEGNAAPGLPDRRVGERLLGAPVVLLVLYDCTRRAPGSPGDVLGFVSLGCVLQTGWLAAEALGLSVQVVSALSRAELADELRRLLGIPSRLAVAFGIRLGHPLAPPSDSPRVRREVDEFTHYNAYRSRPGTGAQMAPGAPWDRLA